MKPKLILMSHGNMAYETYQSAKMIVGEIGEVEIVSMCAEDGLSGTQGKLEKILSQYSDQPILIIADLKGGTPCNVAMMNLSKYSQLRIVTGLNLAMVIEALMSTIEDIDELADYIYYIGQQAVVRVQTLEDDEDDEIG